MDIDYTVAALMFPAIPLMMTMYSNRFHTLSALILSKVCYGLFVFWLSFQHVNGVTFIFGFDFLR